MKYKSLLTCVIAIFTFALTGCNVGNVPTSYTDSTTGAVVQYSATDQNILKVCATIEANLSLIRSAASLTVGGVLQASIKQPSTLQNDGSLCWQISSAVYSMTSATQTSLPNGSTLTKIVGGFTSNVSDTTVLNDVGLITNALNNVYVSYYNQLQAMAAKTDNKLVQAQIVKTGLDVLNALAGGVMDGTSKYAPSPVTATLIRKFADDMRLV